MEKRDIERINALTRLSRERELTPVEQTERRELRARYLVAFRNRFRAQLDSTVIEYPDGSRTPLRDANRQRKN